MTFDHYVHYRLMTLSELYRDYCGRCTMYYGSARATLDTDALHDFRVTVRRLRLLVEILDDMDVVLWPKSRRRLIASAFQLAGAMRDIQTQNRLWSFWNRQQPVRIMGLRTMLRAMERDTRDRFERHMSAIPIDVLLSVTPDISEKLQQADVSRLDRIIQRATAPIPELLAMALHPDRKQIHPLRIRIKKAKYLLDVAHQLLGATKESTDLRAQLASLQDRFGFWHDLQIHRTLAKQFLGLSPRSSAQIETVSRYRDKLRRVQDRLLSGRFTIPAEFI